MTPDDIVNAATRASDEVLEHCTPGKMSKGEAKDFLEQVIETLQTSVDALTEEIEDDDQ